MRRWRGPLLLLLAPGKPSRRPRDHSGGETASATPALQQRQQRGSSCATTLAQRQHRIVGGEAATMGWRRHLRGSGGAKVWRWGGLRTGDRRVAAAARSRRRRRCFVVVP